MYIPGWYTRPLGLRTHNSLTIDLPCEAHTPVPVVHDNKAQTRLQAQMQRQRRERRRQGYRAVSYTKRARYQLQNTRKRELAIGSGIRRVAFHFLTVNEYISTRRTCESSSSGAPRGVHCHGISTLVKTQRILNCDQRKSIDSGAHGLVVPTVRRTSV